MARALALWDETRQQLSASEYYALWRDDRVRDAGIVSDQVEAVGLYDKQGRLLAPPRKDRPMLSHLPGQALRGEAVALLQQENGGSHFSLFLPVHADPGATSCSAMSASNSISPANCGAHRPTAMPTWRICA